MVRACGRAVPWDSSSGGQDESSSGGSETGGGTFACGPALSCDAATEYCQETIGGKKGAEPGYACVVLPEGCGDAPACECLAAEPCGDVCEAIEGGLQITCLAP